MSNLSNIARPYAQAVFELAQSQGDYATWGSALDLLAGVAQDASVRRFINNPHVSSGRLEQLILDICSDHLNADSTNLVKLLVKNGRIDVLPEIAAAYRERRAEAEKVIEAKMITATKIDEPQQQKFTEALQVRLGRTVKLDFDIDEALIGGAVIRAGDWVIDGSVKAQLEQLVGAINA